jgi:hypothetical protein
MTDDGRPAVPKVLVGRSELVMKLLGLEESKSKGAYCGRRQTMLRDRRRGDEGGVEGK